MKKTSAMLLIILMFSLVIATNSSIANVSEKPIIKERFQQKVWDRINDSYVGAKGVSVGNTQAMVAWGSSETNGSLMAAIQHRIPIGVAEIHAKNGTYAVPLVSWGYMAIIYDFVGEVNRTMDGAPNLVKAVNLHQADWSITTAKFNETEDSVEYQLTATTTTPYVNSSLPAPTITITFHLFANYTVLNNATQKVFVIEKNSDGEITIAREERNATVPVTRVGVKFKMDYEITNWTPESNTSKILIGFRIGLFESHSLLINRLFRALKRQNDTITAPPEFKQNTDLQRPIFFRDVSRLPKKFGWVPTANVDGEDSHVVVRFWNIKATYFRYSIDNSRFIGKGVMGDGAFIYKAGTTIIHDPDMQVFSEDISSDAAASILQTLKTKTGLLPFFELTIALASIFVLAPIIVSRRK